MTSSKTRLLIVDDNAQVRADLRDLLELSAGVKVIGEAGSGTEAVQLARNLHPDIVLMDLEMPGLDGYEAARQIKSLELAAKVFILTVHSYAAAREKALLSGADAFFVKDADLNALLDLLERETRTQAGENDRPVECK